MCFGALRRDIKAATKGSVEGDAVLRSKRCLAVSIGAGTHPTSVGRPRVSDIFPPGSPWFHTAVLQGVEQI